MIVFVILASLDNVAINLVPPLYGSIADEYAVGEGHIALATTVMFLISAVAAIGFVYVPDRPDQTVPATQMAVPMISTGLRSVRSPRSASRWSAT